MEAAPASAGPSLRSTYSQDYGETPAVEGGLQATYSQVFAAEPPDAEGSGLRATYSQDFEAEPEAAEGGGERATYSPNFQAEAAQGAGKLSSRHSVCWGTAAQQQVQSAEHSCLTWSGCAPPISPTVFAWLTYIWRNAWGP